MKEKKQEPTKLKFLGVGDVFHLTHMEDHTYRVIGKNEARTRSVVNVETNRRQELVLDAEVVVDRRHE
jgi:hypothetical protein